MIDKATPLVRPGLKTPRAAAVAGIVFSILLIVSMWLLRVSIPTDPLDLSPWLQSSSRRIRLALNLIPFAGIAFMWFLGVLRDRLGTKEDQFFATVFLGSGLMFLGMLFVAASATGGLIRAYGAAPDELFHPSTFAFARSFSYDVMHIYAFKMAAVFMMTSSTLILRTRVAPAWLPLLGFVLAILLIFGSGYFDSLLFVFPVWVLLLSGNVLAENLRHSQQEAPTRA